MPSIHDVAKLAGVSITTVSKVINNYPDVSAKTRKKVAQVIDELKYQPNVVARGLVKGRSWCIGIFLKADFSNTFVSTALSGMQRTLENSGYDLIYLSQEQKDADYNFVKHCVSRNVDGVVVFGHYPNENKLVDLIKSEIPTMFIDLDLLGKRAGYITSDNYAGYYSALKHLYQLGHRKIGYITPELDNYISKVRYDAYLSALRKLSLPYSSDYVHISPFGYILESGYKGMQKLLQLDDRPTAVMCISDLIAIGAIRAVKELGLKVPEDVAIIGYDNSGFCDLVTPQLTSVNQNIECIGERSIEELIKMIDDPAYTPNEIIINADLAIRQSCGATLYTNRKASSG